MRHTRGPSPSTQTVSPLGDAASAKRVAGGEPPGPTGSTTGVKVSSPSDRHRSSMFPLARLERGPQPSLLGARRCSPDRVGARQRLAAVAGRQARDGRPRQLRPAAAPPLDEALGGRRHEPCATWLFGEPEDAGAEEVGGLGGEDRIGLRLRRRTHRVQHADAREHVPRAARDELRPLARADPDLVVLRVVVELDQQAATGEGRGEQRFRGRVGRAPAAEGLPRCPAVVGVPDPASGRRRVRAAPADRLDPDVADAAGDPRAARLVAGDGDGRADRRPQIGGRARARRAAQTPGSASASVPPANVPRLALKLRRA